jgi:SAM-dependent methyltransferase
MSEVVAGVHAVVTAVAPVVSGVSAPLAGVPAVVPGDPAVIPGIPLPRGAPQPGSDDLRQVLHDVIDHNRAVYDALAPEYDRKALKHLTTTHDRVDRVAEHIAPGSEILDVGCGVGLALLIFSEYKKNKQKELKATGVDVSPRMVELACKNSPDTVVVLGDFLTASVGGPYDAIWEQALLHLFPSAAEDVIFERFRDLLKPDGILSLSTTISETSKEGWEPKTDYGSALVRYRRSITEAELGMAFTKHGFGLLETWVTVDPFGKAWRTVVGRKKQ